MVCKKSKRGQTVIEFQTIFLAILMTTTSFLIISGQFIDAVERSFQINRVRVVGERVALFIDSYLYMFTRAVMYVSAGEITGTPDKLMPWSEKQPWVGTRGVSMGDKWYVQVNLVRQPAPEERKAVGKYEEKPLIAKAVLTKTFLNTGYTFERVGEELYINIPLLNYSSPTESVDNVLMYWW